MRLNCQRILDFQPNVREMSLFFATEESGISYLPICKKIICKIHKLVSGKFDLSLGIVRELSGNFVSPKLWTPWGDNNGVNFLITGEVIGVNNRYEDYDKQTIDAAIKGLRPHVFPQDYHLAFCDILDSDGNKISK